MGNDIQPGHTYSTSPTGRQVSAENLNAHVGEATLKETSISARTLKDPAQLSDQLLIADGGLKRITLQVLFDLFGNNLVVGSSQIGSEAVTDLKIAPLAIMASHLNSNMLHGQTLKATPDDTDELLVWDPVNNYFRKVTVASLPSGSVIQTVAASPYTANTALSVAIPLDDTIPQNNEGTQILSASITPTSASNKVMITVVLQAVYANGASCIAALFAGAGADAIATTFRYSAASSYGGDMIIRFLHSPATTSPITYAVRAGAETVYTMYLNGFTTGRRLGGTCAATLTLQEIKA